MTETIAVGKTFNLPEDLLVNNLGTRVNIFFSKGRLLSAKTVGHSRNGWKGTMFAGQLGAATQRNISQVAVFEQVLTIPS
jgi:hypothetical protein